MANDRTKRPASGLKWKPCITTAQLCIYPLLLTQLKVLGLVVFSAVIAVLSLLSHSECIWNVRIAMFRIARIWFVRKKKEGIAQNGVLLEFKTLSMIGWKRFRAAPTRRNYFAPSGISESFTTLLWAPMSW